MVVTHTAATNGSGGQRLRGKVALVTGAARGLGRGITVEFARQGARLVLSTSKDVEGLAATARLVRELCAEAAAGFETGLLRDGTTRLSRASQTVYHLAFVSSFAQHAVVPANGAIAVADDLAPLLTCLLGCGVTTGVLSVTKRANVRPGDSVAVFGCGGVGLSAIQGARLVSAYPIVAVDPVEVKRDLAMRLGATHTIDPSAGDPVSALRALLPGGADFTFDAIGQPEVSAQAFAATTQGA